MEIFEFTFGELNITMEDIEILMGFKPKRTPYPFSNWIKEALSEASTLCNLKGGFDVFNSISVNTQIETIRIENQLFHAGKMVISQLKNATSIAVFACTAGQKISDSAKLKYGAENDLRYYIMDIIGTVTVEKIAEKIQERIDLEATKKELKITCPFSPGYYDWNVAEQQKLFSLLPQDFCGIFLSGSSVMTPLKSISGITGIGKKCYKREYKCNWCNDTNCIYGKIKRRKNL